MSLTLARLGIVAGSFPIASAFVSGSGYIALGQPNFSTSATVNKFAFNDDTRLTLGTGLSLARYGCAGFASSTAGYFSGGFSGNPTPRVATVDKFLFSDDTRSTLGTGLSVAVWGPSGFSSSTHGYAGGGQDNTAPDPIDRTTVNKFAFSDDSRTTLANGLSLGRYMGTGFQSSTSGYHAGGAADGGTIRSTVDKWAFSSDSRTTLATGLATAVYGLAGFESSTHGYAGGGRYTSNIVTVNKFAFSDDSRTTLAEGLSLARENSSGGMASAVAGYIAGGESGGSARSTVDKWSFVDDSRTTLAAGLSAGTIRAAGFESPSVVA